MRQLFSILNKQCFFFFSGCKRKSPLCKHVTSSCHFNMAKPSTRKLGEILRAGLTAANPYAAVSKSVTWASPTVLTLNGASIDMSHARNVLVVGAGKASIAMTSAIVKILQQRPAPYPPPSLWGHVVTKYGHLDTGYCASIPSTICLYEAAHPVPDAAGMNAAELILRAVSSASAADTVVFLMLSGGGSALLPLPVDGVSLDELQQMNNALLRCGADIDEINAIRKHTSRISGGQLVQACAAKLISIVLSDVVGDAPHVIASGPTVADESTFADCWDIISRYKLEATFPISVVEHLRRGSEGRLAETPKHVPVTNLYSIIASNAKAVVAVEAAARTEGYHAYVVTTRMQGEANEIAKLAAGIAADVVGGSSTAFHRPACIIFGGETTVNMTTAAPTCHGGRNQELALACLVHYHKLSVTPRDGARPERVHFAALGTDGTDGPTMAAGAITNLELLSAANSKGVHAADHLRRHDSFSFFEKLGSIVPPSGDILTESGLLVTGPTGTNVMDIFVIFID
jgi:glycerate 2-kinase